MGQLADTMEYERNEGSPWVKGSGEYDGFTFYFMAKVYDEPSEFGIDDGRVSKLIATEQEDNWNPANAFIVYDRGWDFYPEDDEAIEILEELVDELEHLPLI